jgi:hypothetical protein
MFVVEIVSSKINLRLGNDEDEIPTTIPLENWTEELLFENI